MQRWTIIAGMCAFVFAGCAGIRFGGSFSPSEKDWVTYGGSNSRAHVSSSEISPPFQERWTYDAQGGILATPLVRDNVLIVTTLHGEIQLVSLDTGKRLGYVTFDGPIRGTPVLSGLNVIIPVASDVASVVYFGLREGRTFWTADVGAVASSPLMIDDRVYVSTLRGTLVAIDKSDGKEKWRFAPSNKQERKPFRSSPVQSGEHLVCGNDDGNLYAVRLNDGRPVWTTFAGGPIFASPVTLGDVVIAASIHGDVTALDGADGSVVWEWKTDAPVYATPSTDGSMVCIADAGGAISALDASTGRLLWQWKAGSVVNAPALLTDQFVYVGSLDKTFTVLKKRTGEVQWQIDVDGRIKVPAVTWNNDLIIVYEDKTVMALRSSGS